MHYSRPMTTPASPAQIPLGVRASRYFGLLTLAFSGPLLVIAGDRPDYFTAYQCDGLDLLVLALVACLAPPLLLTLFEALTGRHAPRTHLVLLFLVLFGIDAQFLAWGLQVHGAGRIVGALVLTALWMRYARVFPATRLQAAPLYLMALLPAAHLLLLSPTAGLLMQGDPAMHSTRVNNKPPVVLLIFDAFPLSTLLGPDRRIDAGRYPNFAALAGHSTFYRNATANHPLTNHSVPTILSGKYPRQGQLPIAADHPNSLFTLLGSSYRMRVVDPYTLLVPGNLPNAKRYRRSRRNRYESVASDVRLMLPYFARESLSDKALGELVQKFAIFHRHQDVERIYEGIYDRASYLREMLADLGPEDRESLIYAHVVLPHAPWIYNETGARYRIPDEARGVKLKALSSSEVLFYWTSDQFVVRQSYQRHLLQARYCDHLLGEMIDRLKKAGVYEDALFIMTSDHGASFGTGKFPRDLILPNSPMVKQGVGKPNWHEIIPVPMFVKLPGQTEGRLEDRNVENIDLLPTIADVLGVELPWEVDGISLLSPAAVKPPRKIFHGFHFEKITLPPEIAPRFAPITERRAWFAEAPADDASWIYKLKPYGDLLGQPLPEDRVGAASARGGRHDPPATQPPGVLTGTVGAGEGPIHLALVQDGKVLSVTRSLLPEEPGPQPWLAFYPPSSQATSPKLYELRGADAATATFHPLKE